ncbi:MAG: hypothetical protein FK730_11290 [Asgard group archaeon]|nr:hypothetical protein [Asgard group archaeon]
MKIRLIVKVLLCVLFIVTPLTFIQTSFSQELIIDSHEVKEETFNVNLVFVEFNSEYTSKEILEEHLPEVIDPFVHINDTIPHSTYNVNYTFSSFSLEEENNFADYIDSIKTPSSYVESRINITSVDNYIQTQTYEDINDFFIPTSGYEIDAQSVKEYLEDDFSSNYQNDLGYTLYLLNLSSLDSSDHSIEHSYTFTLGDADATNIVQDHYSESYIRRTMGWGGDHRFSYIDLSAISSAVLYINLLFEEDLSTLPFYAFYDIDTFTQTLNLSSSEGKEDLVTYISQWIHTYLKDIYFSPPYHTFPVNEVFELPLIIFSNISDIGYSFDDISWIISSERINSYLQDGFPWIDWQISVEFFELSDFPEIYNHLNENILHNEEGPYVALDEVIEILEEKKYEFFEQDSENVILPSFIFITNNVNFRLDNINIGGFAMGDYQILIRPLSYIFIDGDPEQPRIGLTHTIVHEIGHNLGLNDHGNGSQFFEDIMSYSYTSHNFSSFSKDTIARYHFDYYYLNAKANLQNHENQSIIGINKITDLLEEGYEDYLVMEYDSAIEKVREAWEISNQLDNPLRKPTILSVVIISGIGFIAAMSVITIKFIIPKKIGRK